MAKKVLIFTLCSIMLSACGGSVKIPAEEINTRLKNMASYEATGKITRIDEKGKTEYTVRQCWQKDGKYRLEILAPDKYKGNYTVYNGKEICQYNPHVKDSIIHGAAESEARNQIFLGEFVRNYFNSEGVSCAVSNLEESRCTVLEAVIPGENKYMASEKLWVDNENLTPIKLVIYDKDGNERYVIEYETFDFDTQFEENTFEAVDM